MTPPGRIADTTADNPSLVAEFSAAAFDSAIQKPINGLSQLGAKLIGHELPQLHLVDVPKALTGGETFAQQAGAAVGTLLPYFGMRALVRGGLGDRLGTGYGRAAVEGGLTGFAMGTLLTPVDKDQNFWVSRFANGVTDAGTFALMNAAGKGFSSTRAMSITAETPLISRIGRGASAGALSGLPAGFAHAELDSITHGKGPAGVAEIAGDMTGYALFGGLLGGAGSASLRSRFSRPSDGEARVNSVVQTAETVAVQTEGKASKNRETAAAQGNETTVALSDATIANGNLPVRPAGIVEASRTTGSPEPVERPVERVSDQTAEQPAEKIIKFKKSGYIDAGDEGSVYSNGDGTVTKVFKDRGRSMEAVKEIFDKLESIGVRTPKIYEYGKTEDGYPAMRMEQVGDGDHLRWQLMMREIQGDDLASLRQQYYAFADAIQKAGIRIDWQTKNMRFQDGKLYILDPSFLKNEPLSNVTVDMYAGLIGPRPPAHP